MIKINEKEGKRNKCKNILRRAIEGQEKEDDEQEEEAQED